MWVHVAHRLWMHVVTRLVLPFLPPFCASGQIFPANDIHCLLISAKYGVICACWMSSLAVGPCLVPRMSIKRSKVRRGCVLRKTLVLGAC